MALIDGLVRLIALINVPRRPFGVRAVAFSQVGFRGRASARPKRTHAPYQNVD